MKQQYPVIIFVRSLYIRVIAFVCVVTLLALNGLAIAAPTVPISKAPLALVEPTHPQVLLVVPNSESMDGNLSGAIMTGSGTYSALDYSASPANFVIPNGFIPPLDYGSNGEAPYTVEVAGTLYDNSPSRLNVAKQAIGLVLQQYAPNFDFGLMIYDTGYPTLYKTWLYMMSGDNGFTFTDDLNDPLPSGATRWVPNPCHNGGVGDCDAIGDRLDLLDDGNDNDTVENIDDRLYISINKSSDDPEINDVLYSSGLAPIILTYGNRTPAKPFSFYEVDDYNDGNISVSFDNCMPSGNCLTSTVPTNAGFVPFSPQVMYSKRGFAYAASQLRTKGEILVDIAPASTSGATTQSEINAYIAKFTKYLKPETNDPDTKEIKAVGGQSPIAALMKWAHEYYTNGVSGHPSPVSNTGCACNQYVVMLTDGLPTLDLNGKAWPPLGTDSAAGYEVSATFNLVNGGTVTTTDSNFSAKVLAGATTTLASTSDQALEDTIVKLRQLSSTTDADGGIQVYIIGMGAGVDPTKNPAAAATMKAMALAGGTDGYFPGTTPERVVQYLRVIFAQIQAANQSSTAVAVSSTSLQGNMAVYQARYDSASYGWSGDLAAYPIDANGNVNQANPNWSARELMGADFGGAGWDTNRLAVTVNSDTGHAVPFRWSHLSTAQQGELSANWNTLSATEKSAFGNRVNYGKAILAYLRGNQANTQDNDGVFRNRMYLLGDIVHSAPLYVGAPGHAAIGGGYADFANGDAVDRTPVIYVGANDGALHAFNADTGHELFVYFPLPVFDRLTSLSLPSYDINHEFYVDGAPNAGNVKFEDSSWHTVLAGGLNSGGKGIYAIDVTDPSGYASETAVADNVLWTITNSTPGFSHLGLTYSQPQIVKIGCGDGPGGDCADGSAATYAAIFGSGYNNDNGKPYLYVVNIETGGLIRSIDLCGDDPGQCSTALANGLSTPVTLSTTGGFVADRAYAGDLQGHLWRIDMSDADPTNWDAGVLFTARSDNDDVQAITTQPVVSRSPVTASSATLGASGYGIMVYFGTGRYLGQPDMMDARTQTLYGVLDTRSASSLNLMRSDLAKRTLAQTMVAGKTVRMVSGSKIDWDPQDGRLQYGWRMALPASGERSITDPVFRSGRVIFTTFTPSTAACSAGGVSRLMIIDSATGRAMPQPELDINGDGKLDENDQTSTGANPVGVALGAGGYAAAPSIVGFNKGPFSDLKLITVSGSPIMSIKERGGTRTSGVKSWAQIR